MDMDSKQNVIKFLYIINKLSPTLYIETTMYTPTPPHPPPSHAKPLCNRVNKACSHGKLLTGDRPHTRTAGRRKQARQINK